MTWELAASAAAENNEDLKYIEQKFAPGDPLTGIVSSGDELHDQLGNRDDQPSVFQLFHCELKEQLMFLENKGVVKAALEVAGINLPETFNVDEGLVAHVEDAKKAEGKDPEAAHLIGIVEAARHVEAAITERQAKVAADAASNAVPAVEEPVAEVQPEPVVALEPEPEPAEEKPEGGDPVIQ